MIPALTRAASLWASCHSGGLIVLLLHSLVFLLLGFSSIAPLPRDLTSAQGSVGASRVAVDGSVPLPPTFGS